jgi:F-type H+-transporting ATPase subunit b
MAGIMKDPRLLVATVVAGSLASFAAGAAEAEQGGGLPQLDAAMFAPQLIWLAISFLLLYLFMSKLVLPRIGEVLDERTLRIEGNLERAVQLKAEADQVRAAYEKALAGARAESQEVLRQTADKLAAEATERNNALGARLNDQVKSAEARILEAKTAAIADIRGAAVDTAQAAATRLLGEPADGRAVESAVTAVLGERR